MIESCFRHAARSALCLLLTGMIACPSAPRRNPRDVAVTQGHEDSVDSQKGAAREREKQEALRLERDRLEREDREAARTNEQRNLEDRRERERKERERIEQLRREKEARDRVIRESVQLRAAYQAFIRESEGVEKLRLAIIQDHRRRMREDRLNREDPDRNFFWRRESAEKFGKILRLIFPAGKRIALFRNPNSLQFQGFGGFVHNFRPELGRGELIAPAERNLTSLILHENGFFILLTLPDSPGTVQPVVRENNYDLLRTRINGELFHIIGIYSDGEDLIRIEAEKEIRSGESGDYYIWEVDTVVLE